MEEATPEYEKMKHYIYELGNHLDEAQKYAYRLVTRHRGTKGLQKGFCSCQIDDCSHSVKRRRD